MTLCHICTVCPDALRYTADLGGLGVWYVGFICADRPCMFCCFIRWPLMARGQSRVSCEHVRKPALGFNQFSAQCGCISVVFVLF